jgi:hypothetical protein
MLPPQKTAPPTKFNAKQRARRIRFSADGFSALRMSAFDATYAPCARKVTIWAMASAVVRSLLFMSLSIDFRASSNRSNRSPSLKRSVNKRGGVNRETREFERLRVADELNQYG